MVWLGLAAVQGASPAPSWAGLIKAFLFTPGCVMLSGIAVLVVGFRTHARLVRERRIQIIRRVLRHTRPTILGVLVRMWKPLTVSLPEPFLARLFSRLARLDHVVCRHCLVRIATNGVYNRVISEALHEGAFGELTDKIEKTRGLWKCEQCGREGCLFCMTPTGLKTETRRHINVAEYMEARFLAREMGVSQSFTVTYRDVKVLAMEHADCARGLPFSLRVYLPIDLLRYGIPIDDYLQALR